MPYEESVVSLKVFMVGAFFLKRSFNVKFFKNKISFIVKIN